MAQNDTLQEPNQRVDVAKLLRRILTISMALNIGLILLHLALAHRDLPPKALGSLVVYIFFLLLSFSFFLIERLFFRPLVQFINKYLVFFIFEAFYVFTFLIWLKILVLALHGGHHPR